MTNPTVFISYSHDSPEHDDRVLALAIRLREEGIDCTLDQYETSPPEGWPKWMDRHFGDDDFVIVICTETYHRRVMGEEDPGKGRGVKWESTLTYQHLYNADAENIRFIPVLFKGGREVYIPIPLQGVTHYRVDTVRGYEDLYRHLTDQPRILKPKLGEVKKLQSLERKQDFLVAETTGPERISLAKLPSTSPDLFGRKKELAMLDAAWDNPQTNIVSLVAWGGVGKTALVNKWLLQMGADYYRGAERVFGWSFYSQGPREGEQVSADPFIAAALEWFGDDDPTKGSSWNKGERLAELVKRKRTLLILDGLEPLQYPPGEMEGRLKDPGLQCLLRELARSGPGLVVISTRLVVDDIKELIGTSVEHILLEQLSPTSGVAHLAHLGVQGTREELMETVEEFEGHPLALTLLGRYLNETYQGDIRQRDKIARLTREPEQGGHALRVMESYERWFKGKPELNILRMMGLFDRPAEGGAIEAIRAEPAIQGLTSKLHGLSHEDWQFVVKNLREIGILTRKDPFHPDTLDCHPLVRVHFGEKLQENNPVAWKEAHSRLYEYYQSKAKEFPDTIEEMIPLFAAVTHGCQAGRHQETLNEVYWKRISRRKEAFSMHKLGAFGADLAAMSGFFDTPWHRPVSGLTETYRSFVLGVAGFDLQALGRLAEAAQPLQVGLEADIALENWENAAVSAGNLSGLYLALGNLTQALDYAQQAVDLADRSGHAFQKMSKRSYLANALHQVGHLSEAEAAFREAEKMQSEDQPQHLFLYSLRGFQYCDMLLGQGKYQEVQSRASQTLEWAKQQRFLQDIALDYLSLGRAYLLQAMGDNTNDFSKAVAHLEQAVDGLRRAGQQDDLPRGLLARAELRWVMKKFSRAQTDLDEAMTIATRGGMRLYEADCHLEYARLHLARGHKKKARESLAKAREMIDDMGYHRRDGAVEELSKVL